MQCSSERSSQMKKIIVLLIAFTGSVYLWAQTPPPGTLSHPAGVTNPPTPPTPGSMTNQFGASNLSFTNSAGGVYSVDQLASQLQSLRATVDQTLPMISAFTQNYSNSIGGPTTVGGAISGILSRVLKETNAPSASAQNATNLLMGLDQSLRRNAAGAAQSPIQAQDLAALQQQLQSMPALLQRLHLGAATNQLAAPSGVISQPGRGAPTGR
jgi:hypothetical protein